MNELFEVVHYTREHQDTLSSKFDCGNSDINMFLLSSKSLDYGYGKTYVAIYNGEILGYYNISTGHIEDENGLRMGGSSFINYFALDRKYQKIRFGEGYLSDLLLSDCFNKVDYIRKNHIGFTFVTLSSTEEGKNLYERNGFELLDDDMRMAKNKGEETCTPMYLPLDYE